MGKSLYPKKKIIGLLTGHLKIKCWDITRSGRKCSIHGSIDEVPVRILLSFLKQIIHVILNFRFYLQV